MKRLSTILKNNSSNLTAYVYRSGIVILKKDKNNSYLSKQYYIKKQYNLPEDVARVVLHDPHDILCFGTDFNMSFFANNSSPWAREKGIEFRLISFNFAKGGKIRIEEYKDVDSPYWNSRGGHISVQGRGYWSNNGIDWTENGINSYTDNPAEIENAWYNSYDSEEISGS